MRKQLRPSLAIFCLAGLFLLIMAGTIDLDLRLGPSITHADHQLTTKLAAPSAVPGQLSYQGYLTDGNGTPHNGTHSMTFAIYAAATGGSPLWSETQASVPVRNGYFSVLLGSSAPFPGGLFDQPTRYLGVQVDTNQEMAPRQAFASVAYAMNAEQAANADHATTASEADHAAAADQAAQADHAEAADQAAQADHVSWSGLTGTPPYSAGAGLVLNGFEFSLASTNCVVVSGSAPYHVTPTPGYPNNPAAIYRPGLATCPSGYQVESCSYKPICNPTPTPRPAGPTPTPTPYNGPTPTPPICLGASYDWRMPGGILMDLVANGCVSYEDIGVISATQARCCQASQ